MKLQIEAPHIYQKKEPSHRYFPVSVFHRMNPELFPLDILQNFSEQVFLKPIQGEHLWI